jgi:AraC-like DNA-binding protein
MRQTDGKLDLCMQLLTGTGDDNAFLRKELEKYLPRLGGPPYCVMRFSFATEGRADGHETLRYVMDMTQEILDRTLSIELVPLGGAQSSAIVSLEGNATMLAVERAAHNVLGAVGTYFNSRLLVGIGRSVAEPAMIRESHHDAIEALRLASSARPVVTFDPDGHAKHDRLMASIKLFVKEHVSERITLQDVADRFGMSPNYLSTTFKKHTGRNLSNYMSEVKIRKAMELMQDKSLMVYQVAEILGYENSYYFSKVFKKVSGMTPKAFLMSGDPPPPEE